MWKKGGSKVRIKLATIPCSLEDWKEAQNEIFDQVILRPFQAISFSGGGGEVVRVKVSGHRGPEFESA